MCLTFLSLFLRALLSFRMELCTKENSETGILTAKVVTVLALECMTANGALESITVKGFY